MNYRKGFGLLEVLIAAVVLGFLIVGLTRLQMSNREGILRIRARDAANAIAQEIIDSLAARGLASVPASGTGERKRFFEGAAGNIEVPFSIKFTAEPLYAEDKTEYSSENETISLQHLLAKRINIAVSWKFKESEQSISMSTVIR